jgi:tetratricopeptide (TPR) repeat protein
MTIRLVVALAVLVTSAAAFAQPARPPRPVAAPVPVAAAVPAFQHVPLSAPPGAQTQVWLALDAMGDAMIDQARGHLSNALAQHRDFAVALAMQGYLARKPEEQTQLLAAAAMAAKGKLLPWEKVWVQILQAQHAGKHAAALKLYDALIKAQPQEPWFHGMRGWAYARLATPAGNERARVDLQKALTLWPTFRGAMNHLGYVLVAQGKHNEALDILTKYASLTPRASNPHDSLGEILLRLKRLKDAEAEYRTALRLDGGFHVSRVGLGYTLVNEGLSLRVATAVPQAHQEYDTAFAKSPEPGVKAQALQFAAMSYLLEGKPSKAIAELERYEAWARTANNPDALAKALMFNGDVHAVLGVYRQASAKADEAVTAANDPRTTPAVKQAMLARRIMIKALVLAELGEVGAAEGRLKELAKLAPNAAWIQQSLGELKNIATVFKGDPKKAVAALAGATEDQPMALFYLGRAQLRAGDLNGARGTFEKLGGSTVLRPDVALWRFAAQEMLRQPVR